MVGDVSEGASFWQKLIYSLKGYKNTHIASLVTDIGTN